MNYSMVPIQVVLIEDSPGDIEITRVGLKRAKVLVDLHVEEEGEAGLKHVVDSAAAGERIDLVLLDLNLPKLDGRDVLKALKSDERTKHIPVVVLTSCEADTEVVKTYGLGANAYVHKPINLERFTDLIGQLEEFWLTIVRLPSAT